jgi:hypothetical protein
MQLLLLPCFGTHRPQLRRSCRCMLHVLLLLLLLLLRQYLLPHHLLLLLLLWAALHHCTCDAA